MHGMKPDGAHICLISRQRIVGRTNGSSVYLLSIVEFLKAHGFHVHYLSPTPATFGRWPLIALKPEMAMFDSIRIRGSLRLGRFLLVRDPLVFCQAALAVLDRLLVRLGRPGWRLGKRAPYAVSVALAPEDADYIARNAPRLADVILLDYAFLTAAIPHVGRPDAPSLVVMHDLFSARASQFSKLGKTDSVAGIDHDTEMRLLGRADLVIAIQHEEADIVRAALPGHPVMVAPCATEPASRPSPGEADHLLFVGSNTAPNLDGLQWFLEEVWPLIRERRPTARLSVAGSVAEGYAPRLTGVSYLGIVDDLPALYGQAGVVVAPLRAGSGLKVKLIEALGGGKAVVATSVTTQGVHELVEEAVAVADDPQGFAAATLALMEDDALRSRRAAAGLDIAHRHFGPEACYGAVVDFVTDALRSRRATEAAAASFCLPAVPANQ